MDVELAARLLKIDIGADEATIRRAYRAEAAKAHPDRLVDASAEATDHANWAFGMLTTAQQVLLDHANGVFPEPEDEERIRSFEEFVAEFEAELWLGRL